jgi:hypothetical protein
MKVSYTCLAPVEKSVLFDESDLASLHGVLVDSFLEHIKYARLHSLLFSYEESVVAICKKYGVDHTDPRAVTSFFTSLLKGNDSNNHKPAV